jgi:hypothetical protein
MTEKSVATRTIHPTIEMLIYYTPAFIVGGLTGQSDTPSPMVTD